MRYSHNYYYQSPTSSTAYVEKENIYSCPMHPEVVSDTPGRCSMCGMNLVLSKREQGIDE